MTNPDGLTSMYRQLGRRLATLRKQAGHTQHSLAAELDGYGRSAIAGAETGKPPARDFWVEVDRRLKTGAELANAYDQIVAAKLAAGTDDLATVFRPALSDSTSGVGLDFDRIAAVGAGRFRPDPSLVDTFARILAEQRRVEDVVGSAPLLVPVTAQLSVLGRILSDAGGAARPGLVSVAAEWAEFAGWLHTSIGRAQEAERYFDLGLTLAAESGGADINSEILSMKGYLAWMRGQVGPMIGLSRAAQKNPKAFPGQHAVSAIQEARGYAIVGDRRMAGQLLGRSAEPVSRRTERIDQQPDWLYYHSQSFFDLQYGLVYRYLGRTSRTDAQKSVRLLTGGLSGLRDDLATAEWAAEYLYHLVFAQIDSGEPEQACGSAFRIHRIAMATGSTRVTRHVERLVGHLASVFPGLPEVTELAVAVRTGK